ncbi:MFS transporter [Acidimangrovimonas pyrenivorans]|uniref:MFS transporter n=1 Tax=Acidimangrovimonas pyrenivorans TaxID=2030798 RepID=A0ABV7AK80_9RHOB
MRMAQPGQGEVQDDVAEDGLAPPRRYFAWATVILGVTLAVLDGTIANVALPTIAQDFQADASVSIWIVNGYQLAIVMALLPLATLGEKIGYRRIYLWGIALFTVASVGCVMSTSLTSLTTARIVQGLGAAGLMSVNTAVLRYIVPQSRFGAALGFNALAVAAAATAGPAIAGFALAVLSWQWLFAINIPLGILTVALGWRSLPESDRSGRRFDSFAAVMSAVSIGLVITTIDSLGHDLPWYLVLLQAVACVVGFALLIRHERRVDRPMLPLDLFRIPIFSLSVAASISAFTAQILAFVSLPFAFQVAMGFPPAQVGLLMMPWPLALAVVAPLAGRLSDSRSPALLGTGGMVLLAVGLLLLGLLPADPGFWNIAWRMVLCGIGFGLFQTPNNRTMIGSAPKPRSGAASGVLGTARLTGQSIGAALVALLLAQLGIGGATWSLFLGAGFAALAGVLSILRVDHWQPPHPQAAGSSALR